MRRRALWIIALATAALLGLGYALPAWTFVLTVALGKGLVVLGLMLLLRTGLVSFGQGLFFCTGAYTSGAAAQFLGIHDAVLLLAVGGAAATVLAALLGLLLAGYRGIFFAMLSLALSMILYGLLVKTSMLGSTDGYNVPTPSLLGRSFTGQEARFPIFALACLVSFVCAALIQLYEDTPLGRLSPAIRDNELRVEYTGASVRNAIHIKYVIAAALAGLGGALTAITVGHVDPDMAYWTTSGEFVFVTILAGTGNVMAPFLGSALFEVVRTFAYQYSPTTWQLVLGAAMLAIIVFLPEGLWSVFKRHRAA